DTVCAASTAYVVEVPRTRIAADVIGDQEVGRKIQVVDDFQFPLDPLQCNFVISVIPPGEAVHRVLLQQLLIVVSVAGKGLFVFGFLKDKVEAALFQQLLCVGDQLGAVPVISQQLVLRNKYLVFPCHLCRIELGDQDIVVNGPELRMQLEIL